MKSLQAVELPAAWHLSTSTTVSLLECITFVFELVAGVVYCMTFVCELVIEGVYRRA
jgi:hypothetical protein